MAGTSRDNSPGNSPPATAPDGDGAGEHAAEAAFHHVLIALAARFPRLVLENCWNGVRPLDLAMVRHHHTTITEDHCRTRPNSLAKVGLGRYLPLDWQSASMGVDELPTRAWIAPYVVGGPWVLMDDPELWTDDDRASIARPRRSTAGGAPISGRPRSTGRRVAPRTSTRWSRTARTAACCSPSACRPARPRWRSSWA